MQTQVKKLYLLRHGETEWTQLGKHTGLTDIPLTKNGKKEAKKLGKSLEKIFFDTILCSPLKRAHDTASIAFPEKKIVIDNDLVEWDYGDYEGVTSKEIEKMNPGWNVFTKDTPNGEARELVEKRADRVIERVLQLSGTVAIVSSGHFSRALGVRWLNLPISYGQYLILTTASKSILGFEHIHPAIECWNDISHL
jgi:broad specificity phosphatase PhoE